MFIQRKRERGELPSLLTIDYMGEQHRETTRSIGTMARNVLLPPEAVKNAGMADLFLAAAKNGERLDLRNLSKNLRDLVRRLA